MRAADPEQELVLTPLAELYIEDRARRDDPEREMSGFHIAIAVLGCILIAVSLFSAVLL